MLHLFSFSTEICCVVVNIVLSLLLQLKVQCRSQNAVVHSLSCHLIIALDVISVNHPRHRLSSSSELLNAIYVIKKTRKAFLLLRVEHQEHQE